jgi:TATA-binding protein-associated factor Taf7
MSDLDNEEYEATKKLQEKTADEMFEDENYIKEFYDKMGDSTTEEKCEVLVYRYYVSEEEIETQIEFYLEDEEVGINGLLNKRVLKAINKKCKELGWL